MVRSEVLEMLEVNENMWFGRLDDDSPKVKWMRRVYLRVDYTQAQWTRLLVPWTVVMLRQPSQFIHNSRRHRRFTGGSAFHTSFRGLLSLLATQQKWYHHLQQIEQSLIPHNYIQHIDWCTQQTVCSTHTPGL